MDVFVLELLILHLKVKAWQALLLLFHQKIKKNKKHDNIILNILSEGSSRYVSKFKWSNI